MVEVLSGTVTSVSVPGVVGYVLLTGQTSAIARTTLFTSGADGLYRINWYIAMTNSTGVSHSVVLQRWWNDGITGDSELNYGYTETGDANDGGPGVQVVYLPSGNTFDYSTLFTTTSGVEYMLALSAVQVS
jgi:hypothetical protein